MCSGKVNAAAAAVGGTVLDCTASHVQRSTVISAATTVTGKVSTAAICSRAVLDGAAIQVNLCGAVVRGRRIVADPQSTVSVAAVKDAAV